jgi:metal-responsive CopG/Arc/MetJ family transcriptional regulator
MRKYPARIDVTLPKEMKAKLRERAKLENISMSEVIRRATRNFRESSPQ